MPDPVWADAVASELASLVDSYRNADGALVGPAESVVSVNISSSPQDDRVDVRVEKMIDGAVVRYRVCLTPEMSALSDIWAPALRRRPLSEIPIRTLSLVVVIHMVIEPLGAEYFTAVDGETYFRY